MHPRSSDAINRHLRRGQSLGQILHKQTCREQHDGGDGGFGYCILRRAAAVLLVSLQGAHPAPVPQTTGPSSSSCTTELLRLLPCLNFLDGAAAAPPDTCCANLGSMVHDEPLCLCQALSQSGSGRSPVAVNMSRAVLLPSLCRLDLPADASACQGLLPEGQAPSPPVSTPDTGVNSTVPSTPVPMTPMPPLTTSAPRTISQNPGYSSGSKLIADAISAALGFMALATVLAF